MVNKLEVWKVSHELVLQVYKATSNFPSYEQFGLVSQLRRAAASIPANIVEGQSRQHKKEFLQFLFIARGSLSETNYFLFLSKELGYMNPNTYDEMKALCDRIGMMLNKLIASQRA